MNLNEISKFVHSIGVIKSGGMTLLGTCFLVKENGLFATAAHVVNGYSAGLCLVLNDLSSLNDYQNTLNTQVKYIDLEYYSVNQFADVCILKADMSEDKCFAIDGSDGIEVSDDIVIIGYPHLEHGRKILTYQNTEVGAKILINSGGILSKHMVLNIQSRPGQSGSPVINKKNSSVVGILVGSYAPRKSGERILIGGIDPQTLHQTTHAVSSEYIKEMIK